MNRLLSTVALALACQFLMTSIVSAQAVPANPASPARSADPVKLWSFRGGLGFTADPDSFLINFEADRLMRDEVAVGFAIQLGLDDNLMLVSPMVFTRYLFDWSGQTSEFARKVKPYAQAGMGLTHLDKDKGKNSGTDTEFSMSFGAGLDYPLNESIEIGSRMLLTIIPAKVGDDRIYFSWEMISVRYRW